MTQKIWDLDEVAGDKDRCAQFMKEKGYDKGQHPKFHVGQFIHFNTGCNDDIRACVKIKGIDGDDLYVYNDCFWFPIQDDARRDIRTSRDLYKGEKGFFDLINDERENESLLWLDPTDRDQVKATLDEVFRDHERGEKYDLDEIMEKLNSKHHCFEFNTTHTDDEEDTITEPYTMFRRYPYGMKD